MMKDLLTLPISSRVANFRPYLPGSGTQMFSSPSWCRALALYPMHWTHSTRLFDGRAFAADAADGAASGSVSNLFTGATQADLVGRAVVIHDYTGARVACAIITPLECPAGCSPITVTPEVIPLPSARRLLFATNPPTCPE
eukprot:6179368-Pleurochrysis_carterae.AAC.2